MTTQLMRTLNNIFYDDDILQEFRVYLQNKPNYQNDKFRAKFMQKPFSQFALINDRIIYKPKELMVIEDDTQMQQALDDLFDDSNTFGKGVTQFYKYVIGKYINIKRADVQAYLQTKGTYQLTQNIAKRTNKPIVAKYVNQTWGIDLIDMNDNIQSNKGWRYIMTVVDIFSRKVFLSRIKLKEANNTSAALRALIDKLGVSPKYILSDNGAEWLGSFEEFCTQKQIKQLFTRSYSPEANGVVERMNKEIRKIIRAFFVRNGNKVWYNILDKVEMNKNETFNSSVGNAPVNIWSADKNEGRLLPNDPKFNAKKSLIQKAMKKIAKFREEDNLEKNQIVRVKMSSIFANVRKLVKAGQTKQIVITYSTELFRIKSVVKPRNKWLERNRYVLKNADGKVLTKNGVAQLFYASELLQYDGEDASDVDIDMLGALKLNGVEPNANDVEY
jgi:transposase InsO family protein